MHTKRLLLDSAHDAMPLYHYFLDEGIQPFVDLNKRSTLTEWHNIPLDENGRPLCPAGLPMHSDGCEKSRMRMKFRCPKLQHCKGKGGKKVVCNCEQKCTASDYGRVVHLPMRGRAPADAGESPHVLPANTRQQGMGKGIQAALLCGKRQQAD